MPYHREEAIQSAIKNKKGAAIDYLIENGANINIRPGSEYFNYYPLSVVCQRLNFKMLKQLIDHDVDCGITDKMYALDGSSQLNVSPLMCVCGGRYDENYSENTAFKCFKLLIEKGKNVNVHYVNEEGHSFIDYALIRKNNQILEYVKFKNFPLRHSVLRTYINIRFLRYVFKKRNSKPFLKDGKYFTIKPNQLKSVLIQNYFQRDDDLKRLTTTLEICLDKFESDCNSLFEQAIIDLFWSSYKKINVGDIVDLLEKVIEKETKKGTLRSFLESDVNILNVMCNQFRNNLDEDIFAKGHRSEQFKKICEMTFPVYKDTSINVVHVVIENLKQLNPSDYRWDVSYLQAIEKYVSIVNYLQSHGFNVTSEEQKTIESIHEKAISYQKQQEQKKNQKDNQKGHKSGNSVPRGRTKKDQNKVN